MIIGFAGEKVNDSLVVPAQGGHQRGRQAVRDRSTSATARSGPPSIVPAPAEKVVFDVEQEAVEGRVREPAEPEKTTINDFGLEVQPLTPELAKPLACRPI